MGLVAFLFLSWAGTPLVWAEDTESPWKTLSVKVGGFIPLNDTGLRLRGPLGLLNPEVDLEDDLELDSDLSTFRIDAHWRFFKRHRFNFSFFDLSRDSVSVIGRKITIGDQDYLLGDVVQTSWKWKVYVASYTWSFLQTDKYEVGLTLGAHVTRVALGFTSLQKNLGQVETGSYTAPLPVVGLTGAYAFTPKLILKSDLGIFALKINEYKGAQANFDLDLEYNAWKYMGFGIGYNFYTLNLEVDAGNFKGEADYMYHGFKFFLKFYL